MTNKIPKINLGDKVPATGLYRLDAGTKIIPRKRKMSSRKTGR